MALQSTAKLHPPLSSTECVSLGLPFFTSSPATHITTPLVAALANRPTCLDGVKPASPYSVNGPPTLQSQNISRNPYAYDRLDPRRFHNAAFSWETTSKALWSHNPSGGDHYKIGIHADTPATHLSRGGLEYFRSPPLLRTASQVHDHAPQGTAREPGVVQPRQCRKVCATGDGACQFPTRSITSQRTHASYSLTLDAQPLSAAGSSLSKLPQDPVNHSYAFTQQAVSTGLACNPDLAVRTRNNDDFTGLENAAMHGLRGSLADSAVNPVDEASENRGELNQISSPSTAGRFMYFNYKGSTASDSQVQVDLYSPSSRCFETRAPQHQQEFAASARSRPCGQEARPLVQTGGTQVSQRTRQAYADPLVNSTYASDILPDEDGTEEGRKDRPPQPGKSDGMYSRESTSSTASPHTSEARKSAAGASLKLNFDCSSSGTNTTEAGKGTRVKEPDAQQDQARELASHTTLCLGGSTSESNKFLENPTIENHTLYSRHTSLPVSSFASPPIRQHTSCNEALQRPLQASQGPNSALNNRRGQTDQPKHSAEGTQDLLDEDQSKYTRNSLPQYLPSSKYQVPSLQPSTQPVSADVRRPTVDQTTSTEQLQTAGDKTNLLTIGHTNIPQRPFCVNRIQSRESDISSSCTTPLAPRHNSGVNSSRPPTATPLEFGHSRMANRNAYSTIKSPALDQLPSLSGWRGPPNTEATQLSANGDYFHKKGSPARTKDVRWNCGVLRPVFKRTVHRGQISAVGRPDWRVREQSRNRVVLERIASAGVTAAAATAAGTLLATSSPAIAGLAVAGVAALLTGLAAASSAADTPQYYRRQRVRQAPAALHSTSSRFANQSKQHAPQGAWPRHKDYTTAWSQNRRQGLGEVTSQEASQLASEILWLRGYGLNVQSPGSNSRNSDPHHNDIMKHVPKSELLAAKRYGTEPCTGTLMLVGRPMEAVLELKL